LSAKSVFVVTTSIFGSAFLGIFLSTIIFEGPSPDSEEFFENESIEKATIPKTPIESIVEEEPEPTPTELEGTVMTSSSTELEGMVTTSSSTELEGMVTTSSSTELEGTVTTSSSTELEGMVTTSSSTGVQ